MANCSDLFGSLHARNRVAHHVDRIVLRRHRVADVVHQILKMDEAMHRAPGQVAPVQFLCRSIPNMGAKESKPDRCVAVFEVSYAPTGRAKCRTCGEKIPKRSVRVTRYVSITPSGGPPTCAAGTGLCALPLRYHLEHGLEAADKVRCGRRSGEAYDAPPELHGTESLDPVDRREVESRFKKIQRAWTKRCASVSHRADTAPPKRPARVRNAP